MIATQTGASCGSGGDKLKGRLVHRGSPHFRIVAALAVTAALGGCADFGVQWFRKPLYLTGQTSGYTFSDTQAVRRDRPITANDLVEANGSCPAAQAQPGATQGADPTGAPDGASLIDEGVALGMSECDVVHRAGGALQYRDRQKSERRSHSGVDLFKRTAARRLSFRARAVDGNGSRCRAGARAGSGNGEEKTCQGREAQN